LDWSYFSNEVYTSSKLDECMTLWGEPEQVHMQNVDKVHAQVYHQNVTEPQYHTKRYTRVQHRNCESGLAKA